MFYTESHFTSIGFEERKELFSCLAEYLNSNSSESSDENLLLLDDSTKSSLTDRSCSKSISQLKETFWQNLNVRLLYSCNDRKKLNKTKQPIDDGASSELKICHSCMKHRLEKTNYEHTKLYTAAVNATIVEFKVWKYFSIFLEISKLIDETLSLELQSLEKCARKGKCDKEIKICT